MTSAPHRRARWPWLDSVPANWDEGKIVYYARLLTGGTPDRDEPRFWTDGTIPWLASGAVNQRMIREPSALITQLATTRSNARLLPPGAVLVALAGQGRTKGMVAMLAIPAACNQSLAAFVCDEQVLHGRYLFYYLDANYRNIRGLVGDDMRDGLSLGLLSTLVTPLPPIREQQGIASFLDRKTAVIDALIAKKERLIDLLQEKRQVLITQAVTKGLDLDVPMKDSGIPWIGIIPTHWKIAAIKRAGRRGSNAFTDGDWIEAPFITDTGTRLIQTGNVGIGHYKEQGFRYVSDATFRDLRCTEVSPGDVLICRLDGPVGRACLAPDLGVRMITSVDNAILKPSPEWEGRYLVYVLSSPKYLDWVQVLCRVGGGFRFRVSRSMLGDIQVPVPPRDEQARIADWLDKHTMRLRQLEGKLEAHCEKLREYRQALITAAVTGKIDVNEAA